MMSQSRRIFDIKARTLFARLDDGNGRLEAEDFKKWAEKLISLGKIYKK